MKRALQIPVFLLTLTLGASVAYAQGRGFSSASQSNANRNNNNNNASQRANASTPAPSRNFSTPQQHQFRPRPQTFHREIGEGVTLANPNPFQQEHHLDGQGLGCANCGYGTYGGYVYPGAYINPNVPPGTVTATDAVLANGGTFNDINAGNQPNTSTNNFDTDVSYMHAQYQAQDVYGGGAQTNSSGKIVSAASNTPAILVFKDGHQVTVENYAIYGAFIVVMSPEQHKYPIAALDIDATQKANQAAGYDLHLPAVFTGK